LPAQLPAQFGWFVFVDGWTTILMRGFAKRVIPKKDGDTVFV
jgi:hypothetical protein